MSTVDLEPQDSRQVAHGDLEVPEELSGRSLRRRLLLALGIVLVVVAVVTLLPGLGALRTRLSQAKPAWLFLGVGLKVLSGLGYVAVFRMVFCRRMTWRVSYQIGMSELGANALFPTGGAGGLALGVWALKRGGMPAPEIARRSVAFFLLTSVPNVVCVIIIGLGLAAGVLPGETNLALTVIPAVVAALAIAGALLAGRTSARLHRRLDRIEAAESSRRTRRMAKALVAVADGVNEAAALLRERNAVLICGLIPVPGGIGGVDAGLVGTLVLYNVPITAATSAVLAYRAIALWVPAILGAGAFVALRHTLRDESSKIAVCVPQTEMEVIGLGRVRIGSSSADPVRPITGS